MSESAEPSLDLPPEPQLHTETGGLEHLAGRLSDTDFLTLITYPSPEALCATGILVNAAKELGVPYHVKPVRTVDNARSAFSASPEGIAIGVGVQHPSELPEATEYDGELPSISSVDVSSEESEDEEGSESGASEFMDGGELPDENAPQIVATSLGDYADSDILSAYRLGTLLESFDVSEPDIEIVITGLVSSPSFRTTAVKRQKDSLPETAKIIIDKAAEAGISVEQGVGLPSRRPKDMTLLTSIQSEFSGISIRDEDPSDELILALSMSQYPNQSERQDIEEFIRERTDIDGYPEGIHPFVFDAMSEIMTVDGFAELLRVFGRMEAGTGIGIASGILSRDEFISEWRKYAKQVYKCVEAADIDSGSELVEVELDPGNDDISPLVGRTLLDEGECVVVHSGSWVCVLGEKTDVVAESLESWTDIEYGFSGEYLEVNAVSCSVDSVISRVRSAEE